MMPHTIDPVRVMALRDIRAHRRADLRVQSEEQALAFINEIGFCFLFGAHGFAMPTLWEAICGNARDVPQHHDDADLGRAWDWKDTLPTRKACFYGKLWRKTATLLSLELLPHVYALSPNYGTVEDYLEEYQDGRMTVEAKWVYEALLQNGPQSTNRLRRLAGLDGKANAGRFDRAIAELQAGLKIVKVGISDANAWGYCYVYDVLLRQYPNLPEQARGIHSTTAEDTLYLRYLQSTVCVSAAEIERLFGWEPWRMERLTARLTARGAIETGLTWPGRKGPYVTRTEDLPLIASP